jgi:LDH2 family malate/lactate/ureidoglycolate dehydrogenase
MLPPALYPTERTEDMKNITGTMAANLPGQTICVDWAVDEEGNVTVNGRSAGRIVEGATSIFYAFPVDGHDPGASFPTAASAAAALIARCAA